MSRELHSRRRQGSYIPGDSLSKPGNLRESSGSVSQTASDYGHGSAAGFGEMFGKLDAFGGHATVDYTRITMKTRVAVRDHTPHRFQVVPLRDVSRLSPSSSSHAENTSRFPVPTNSDRPTLRPIPANHRTSNSKALQSDQLAVKSASKDKREPDGSVDPELTSNQALVKGSEPGGLVSSRSRPVIACLPVSERNMILANWDLNRERKRSTTRSSQQVRPTTDGGFTHKSATMSIDSIHQLIRSESPLTQTISRSLECRTPSERRHPKPTSLSNIRLPKAPQPMSLPDSKAVRRKSRALSEAQPRRHEKTSTAEDSYYALLDSYEASEAMVSTKRHAIYTPSLYVPHFEQPSQLQQADGTCSNQRDRKPDPPCNDSAFYESDAIQDSSLAVEPENINIRQSLFESSQDQDLNPRRAIEEPFDLNNPGSMDWLSADVASQALKHKSSSRSLPLRLPRGLNYSKPSRSLQCATDSRPGEIVYSDVTLGLFADIDKATQEWNH